MPHLDYSDGFLNAVAALIACGGRPDLSTMMRVARQNDLTTACGLLPQLSPNGMSTLHVAMIIRKGIGADIERALSVSKDYFDFVEAVRGI